MKRTLKVACIGFGEAGRAFAKGWVGQGFNVSAFDIKTNSDATRVEMMKTYAECGVEGANSAEEVVRNADAIFSLVTADQARTAALSAINDTPSIALFFDCNSCAPDTKRGSAVEFENAGLHYVDAAIMAPVHPRLHQTAVSISGPHSNVAAQMLKALNMNATVLEGDVGTASATKMVRSIMMKGLEAVMIECILAGQKADVSERVLESLDKTYPGFDFKTKANYMLERVMVHGQRRAAEMREVALTIEHLGLDNPMASATVEWQQKIGDLKLDPDYGLPEDDYGSRAELILNALKESKD